MTFFGISNPKASYPYRRSNTPTISAPLPFPPSYYLQNISTPILNPPLLHPGLANTDPFQQPPRPAPPPPNAVASQQTRHSPHFVVHPAPPPLEDHPAFRDIQLSMNNGSTFFSADDKSSGGSQTFIPFSPSDYEISRLSNLSSNRLPPTPPNSPPIPPSRSPTPAQARSTPTWKASEQPTEPLQAFEQHSKWHHYHRHLYHPLNDSAPTTSKGSTRASLNSDSDKDHSSSGGFVELSDLLSGKLDEVIASIDGQEFSGMEKDLRRLLSVIAERNMLNNQIFL